MIEKFLKNKRLVFVSIVAAIVIVFLIVNLVINKKTIDNFEVRQNNGEYSIEIDRFEKEGGELQFYGWCFKIGEHPFDFNQKIKVAMLLKNKNDDRDIIQLTTDRQMRPELNDWFPSNTDYKYSGFSAVIKESKLDKDTEYEVLMFYDTWEGNHGLFGYTTGYSVKNGELIKPVKEETETDKK